MIEKFDHEWRRWQIYEEDKFFQQSTSCWICKKLIDDNEEKVRDHCHVTGKFRGGAYWDCNKTFELTKKFLEYFTIWESMAVI